jgi:hypothetical protein
MLKNVQPFAYIKVPEKRPRFDCTPQKDTWEVTGTQYELDKTIQLLENGFNISHIIRKEWELCLL